LSVLDASDAKCLCGCRHGNKRDTNVILVARDGHVEDGLLDPVAHLEPCFQTSFSARDLSSMATRHQPNPMPLMLFPLIEDVDFWARTTLDRADVETIP
jgi:hypothetical protein